MRRNAWFDRLALVAVALFALWLAIKPWQNDAYTYWAAWGRGLYANAVWPDQGAYVYSPAFAQLIYPLTLLPFAVFWALVVCAQTFSLLAITGPRLALLVLVVPWLYMTGYWNPVDGILGNGNIMLILAAVAAFGLRYPALWSFAILTKITPGVALVWFAVRREWRNLGIALGVTAAVTAVSFVLAPNLWREWVDLLRAMAGAEVTRANDLYPFPLLPRVVTAALIVAWGARTDRPLTVPLAVMLAMPGLSSGALVVGVGALYYLRSAPEQGAQVISHRRRYTVDEERLLARA